MVSASQPSCVAVVYNRMQFPKKYSSVVAMLSWPTPRCLKFRMIWGHRAVMKMQVAAVISTFRTLRFRNTGVKNSGRGYGRCACARGDRAPVCGFPVDEPPQVDQHADDHCISCDDGDRHRAGSQPPLVREHLVGNLSLIHI